MSFARRFARRTEARETLTERAVREVYAAHWVLWNIGFSPNDIFVAVRTVVNASPPGQYAVVILRAQGREFIYHTHLMPTSKDADEFEAAWIALAEKRTVLSIAERDRLVGSSELYRHGMEFFLEALRAKGFELLEGAGN